MLTTAHSRMFSSSRILPGKSYFKSRSRARASGVRRSRPPVSANRSRKGSISLSIEQVIARLNVFIRGWWGYFRHAEVAAGFRSINYWIRRRLRAIIWKHWKNPRTRVRNLKQLGIFHLNALLAGCSRKGAWRMSKVNGWLSQCRTPISIRSIFFCPGLVLPDQPNRVVRTRSLLAVGGGSREATPYPDRPSLAPHTILPTHLLARPMRQVETVPLYVFTRIVISAFGK